MHLNLHIDQPTINVELDNFFLIELVIFHSK